MNRSTLDIYPLGLDLVWLALDQVGHAGAFITAGTGPIPVTVLEATFFDGEVEEALLNEISSRILDFPQITEVCLLTYVPRPETYIELAERGLFVYDWTDIHRSRYEFINGYELVAFPRKPILEEFTSKEIIDLTVGQKFRTLNFTVDKILDVRNLVTCEEGSE